MIPKRVTLENFLSFGDKQIIDFDREEVLWVIAGPNGSGKSAVFDAMTYCLFGNHRASGRQLKDREGQLIRHGANAFQISFEFEFNGVDYRITRNRKRGGKPPTQSLEQHRADGEWERVPNVNNSDELDKWVQRTLGLGSDAFESSVLLRQGKADAFVDAKATQRFETLKRIINLEEVEHLARLVHEKTIDLQRETRVLKQRRDQLPIVTETELRQAELLEHQATEAKTSADQQVNDALELKHQSQRWQNLREKHRQLSQKKLVAESLLQQAEQIKNDYEHYSDLKLWLTKWKSWLNLQQDLAKSTPLLDDISQQKTTADEKFGLLQKQSQELAEKLNQLTQDQSEANSTIMQLQQSIKHTQGAFQAAKDLMRIEGELRQFSDSLAQDLDQAKKQHGDAVYAEANARDEKSRLSGLVKEAQSSQKKMTDLQIGVNCSACGQPVTAEHAQRERQLAAEKVMQLTKELDTADTDYHNKSASAAELKTRLDTLDLQSRKREKLLPTLEMARRQLSSFGVSEDIPTLEKSLKESNESLASQQKQADSIVLDLQRNKGEQQTLRQNIKTQEQSSNILSTKWQKLTNEVIGQRTKLQTLQEELPPAWQNRAATELHLLEADWASLHRDQIETKYNHLQQQGVELLSLDKQLKENEHEQLTVPESGRISQDQANYQETQAREACSAADQQWRVQHAHHAKLRQQHQDCVQLIADISKKEAATDLHATLDEHLGKTGLQRALMRDAEQQIVELARETLTQLSDGQMNLELNEKREDEALNLAIRLNDSSYLTPLEYLSGSQKFRVAIAIALAIGRYSAGQARPLECVIIDEGFGSLDRDGLAAMAEELKQLQQKQSLRRIILVSHQEEFVSYFSAGYRLTPGELGTTVENWSG